MVLYVTVVYVIDFDFVGIQAGNKNKLDNVAINYVLPLKAARRDAIANFKMFWGLGHHSPNFDGYIYIQYAATPYSVHISAIPPV